MFTIDRMTFLRLVTLRKCQMKHAKKISSFHFGELEETTRTPSYYADDDYPARPKIQQPLPEWSFRHGSESSTLETDVYIWCNALLVLLAIKQEV